MLFWLFCAFYVSISYKNARIRSWWYLHRYYSSDCNSLWLGHFKQEQHSDLYAYAISRNLNKIQTRKLHKLNQFVYALFTQRKKKALTIARKCLIFRVDQPGLEPGTSRLWVCCSNQLSYKSIEFLSNSSAKIIEFEQITK